MQEIETSSERTSPASDISGDGPESSGVDKTARPLTGRPKQLFRRNGPIGRLVPLYLLLLILLLMAVLPPLLNVNRFKRRIVTSISASIGRPVHLDSVSLVLLPLPAFKLENFVVAEDSAFGAEPVIHANNVQATLRFSSLWRRRVEFSRISLQEPSINLVHAADGRWNVESILLQAARIPAAPTAQAKAGPDPRFPYIEATDARLNIKSGDEKLPFSLTEAEFALWLPEPRQWHLRIEGKPTRTDTSASDTGTVSLEATLGSAERFDLIPLDLSAEWKKAPLGEASRVVTGRDAGLRGDGRLKVSAHGTIGGSAVKMLIDLTGVRRADFVPPHSLDIHAECQANATANFRAFHAIRCAWPPPTAPSLFAITGDLPDIRNAAAASFEVGSPGLPAANLVDWLRVASPRVSPEIAAAGTLSGTISCEPGSREPGSQRTGPSTPGSLWLGRIRLREATLSGGPIGEAPISFGGIAIASGAQDRQAVPVSRAPIRHGRHYAIPAPTRPPDGEFLMAPTTIALGGKEPALLDGRFDRNGYSLHLSGNVLRSRLMALAEAIPQFGDGLSAALPAQPPVVLPAQVPGQERPPTGPSHAPEKELPVHVDLTSSRPWAGGQIWSKTPILPVPQKGSKPHFRR